MRVLLIQPNQGHALGLQGFDLLEPLGLEMIAGALQDQHEVALLDLRVQPDALAATLADFRPQVVGISSTFTMDIYQSLGVAEAVKAADPSTFVMVGGHHPSLHPVDFGHAAIDAIVVGEGERTAKELVECLAAGDDPARVPGLVLNDPDGQLPTAQRPFLQDLDELPYPARSLNKAHRRYYHLVLSRPVASVETARGCPHRCSFCAVWPFYQGAVRFKSPSRVVEELEAIEEPKVFFTDDNFLSNVPRAIDVARLIRERGIRKAYFIQARSDAIVRRPDVIAQWREIGLDGVFIGFERPTQAGLEMVNKHNSIENNERALEIVRHHGIEPNASFIVDPDYGHDDFATLRDYVRRLRLRSALFAVLTPLPGTVLYGEVKEQLTTTNYERFDLLHAVLPSRLPLDEFYEEVARLYREAYPPWKLVLATAYFFLQNLWPQKTDLVSGRKMLAEMRRLQDARTYLRA